EGRKDSIFNLATDLFFVEVTQQGIKIKTNQYP
ncbi:unnamed protein product, partial [marine sediment metagenome]